MPRSIRKLRLGRTLTVLAGAVGLIGFAPALASACTLNSSSGSQVFAKFGDTNNYTLAPNGTLSNGTTGWSLQSAWLVAGGPGLVGGDGQSLLVSPNGAATTPSFCMGYSTPTVRLMTREPGGSGYLTEYALWTDWAGQAHSTYLGWTPSTSAWSPSWAVQISSLPLWEAGQTLTLRLQFVPQQSATNWFVNDVFIDPWGRG